MFERIKAGAASTAPERLRRNGTHGASARGADFVFDVTEQVGRLFADIHRELA